MHCLAAAVGHAPRTIAAGRNLLLKGFWHAAHTRSLHVTVKGSGVRNESQCPLSSIAPKGCNTADNHLKVAQVLWYRIDAYWLPNSMPNCTTTSTAQANFYRSLSCASTASMAGLPITAAPQTLYARSVRQA